MSSAEKDQLLHDEAELFIRMKPHSGTRHGALRRRSPVFTYFFGVCAVVFAVTVVWTVTRTLGVQWWGEDMVHEGLYGPAGAGEEALRTEKGAPAAPPDTEEGRIALLQDRANATTGVMFKHRPLIIWSNDYHISPILDLKHTLRPLGVSFVDKSLSNDCWKTASCARNLRVLQHETALNPPKELVAKFQLTYSHDPEMLSVDAFVCFHPAAMCELFMAFNKSMLVIATTRYEMGRLEPESWMLWNEHLLAIHKDPKNLVATNNLYDAKYMEYFTGIKPLVLPSICNYVKGEYNPRRSGFLLAPIHKKGFENVFLKSFNTTCENALGSKCKDLLLPLRSIYKKYKFSDLASHQGIVYAPYQVSVMSIFEQYSMGVPLFFPSVDLLAEWHLEHQVLVERTWAGVEEQVPSNSSIPAHPSQTHVPDPNCDTDLSAIKHWIRYADFYQLPHIIHYDSFEDLLHKLRTSDLLTTSAKMREFKGKQTAEIQQKWRTILYNVAKYSINKPV